MEHETLLLQYDTNDLLLINVENERCENKYENLIKDENKQIKIIGNGNFLIANFKKRMISQYILSKNAPVCSKYIRLDLSVLTISRDDTIIFGGDRKGIVYIWNRYSGLLINNFQAHYGDVKNIVIDQNINVVYTYGDEHSIHAFYLNDILSKKKIKPFAKYQQNVYDRVKQIIPITPNIFYPYKTFISLTFSGTIYIFGLRSEYPTDIFKTKSDDCNFICTNELFNTHLYLCKANMIYRLSLSDDISIQRRNKKKSKVSIEHRNLKNQEESKIKPYEDFIQTLNKEINVDTSRNIPHYTLKESTDIEHTIKAGQDQLVYNSDNDINSSSSSANEAYIPLKEYYNTMDVNNITCERMICIEEYTVFIGHKNEVLKCHVNEKKNWLISLAKDGIRIWDLFNCYTIKTLKYGENITNFYIPSSKLFSYFIEFPNLVLEYEEEVKVNVITEMKPDDINTNDDFFFKNENPLINLSSMFSQNECKIKQ